jgi:hypothetical protein
MIHILEWGLMMNERDMRGSPIWTLRRRNRYMLNRPSGLSTHDENSDQQRPSSTRNRIQLFTFGIRENPHSEEIFASGHPH